jgi:hypothetical protein
MHTLLNLNFLGWEIPTGSYLRDTAVLQAKHVTALEQSFFDFISFYGENPTTLPDIVPDDDSMGLY